MSESQDLFTSIDESEIRDWMVDHPGEFADLLAGRAGEAAAAAEALSAMRATEAEERLAAAAGLFDTPPPIDPSLPELVLVHGITDCHLADVSGRRNRIWLDFIELIKGSYSRSLTLEADGTSDAPGVRLEPDGHLKKKYQKALDYWRSVGVGTHAFCYDWRRGVGQGADSLHRYLSDLESVKRGSPVVLVCHSMGGLVASTFAGRHADWSDLVRHCVFAGSPLGGSFSPIETILGLSESLQKMDRLSLLENLGQFRRMVASFPGLIDMLPREELFPGATPFYDAANWPSEARPDQRWLDQSRELKRELWESPIFSAATHLVSQDRSTTVDLRGPHGQAGEYERVTSREGDGAVPNRSSLAPGLEAYRVDGDHGMLLREQSVWLAVESILRGGSPDLPGITADSLTGEVEVAAAAASAAGLVDAAALVEPEPTEEIALASVARGLAPSFVSATALAENEAPDHRYEIEHFERAAFSSREFSWEKALALAIASKVAYQKDEKVVKQVATAGWGFDGCECFNLRETQGFVCWDDENVILSFRGTQVTIGDWLRNLNVVPTTQPYGTVHLGFRQGFEVVRSLVVGHLENGAGLRSQGKRLWITGHSLGGALSVIAGAEFVDAYDDIAGIYTYGQPKVGNGDFAGFYEDRFSGRYHRFVNDNDIVPTIPPGYRHNGELYWFDDDRRLERAAAQALAPAGLVAGDSSEEAGRELTEAEFQTLKQELDRLYSPVGAAGQLRLPPSDEELDELLSMQAAGAGPEALALPRFRFRLSVSDHSLAEGYLPAVEAQLPPPTS